jgi:NCS1 family nucleobase:cation symporter-1
MKWVIGISPCLPGFIAALNPSIVASDGAVELYYMNYLYGFLSSACLYFLLHWTVPDKKLDTFLKSDLCALELQQLYDDRWQVTMGQTPENFDESVSRRNEKDSHSVKVSA